MGIWPSLSAGTGRKTRDLLTLLRKTISCKEVPGELQPSQVRNRKVKPRFLLHPTPALNTPASKNLPRLESREPPLCLLLSPTFSASPNSPVWITWRERRELQSHVETHRCQQPQPWVSKGASVGAVFLPDHTQSYLSIFSYPGCHDTELTRPSASIPLLNAVILKLSPSWFCVTSATLIRLDALTDSWKHR